ncbi:MAG: hypothetical protein KME31_36085 [Tolypothrix carrinoi HA7290-LM1]|nr:hypothetical protein [Tolypothrix carrinoi HA7290-LM1]
MVIGNWESVLFPFPMHLFSPLKIPITHYPLPITHYPLPITHYPLPIPHSPLNIS